MQVDDINNVCKNSLIDHLGIEFTEFSGNVIKATMPVDNRTKQPLGLLHGGATMALVETVGSVGSFLIVDREKFDVVGLEINGNHVGNTFGKMVYAVGKLVHKGRRTHVWSVDVYDETDKPISICRITNMILEKNGN
ncbi:MAG: hotdog fold thioesterase [Bacteroidales bacterium]|nr:hotdog fold thioesterase [Bacteroidales bacterium]